MAMARAGRAPTQQQQGDVNSSQLALTRSQVLKGALLAATAAAIPQPVSVAAAEAEVATATSSATAGAAATAGNNLSKVL
jgi:hypothetical protein